MERPSPEQFNLPHTEEPTIDAQEWQFILADIEKTFPPGTVTINNNIVSIYNGGIKSTFELDAITGALVSDSSVDVFAGSDGTRTDKAQNALQSETSIHQSRKAAVLEAIKEVLDPTLIDEDDIDDGADDNIAKAA